MNIRCAIVDDEPIAAKGIAGYASKIPVIHVVGIYHSALELDEAIKKESIDLVFLDIEMPYLSGIDWLKSIKVPPKIIFTTAYDQYALEGFELDVLDYLLKPVSFQRFFKAVNKAQEYFSRKEDHIYIKADGQLEKMPFEEILYIESLQNYVIFHTEKRNLISHITMKSVQEQLPAHIFLRTHKSYLINRQHISSIKGLMIQMKNDYKVPIGKTQKEEVLLSLTNQKILKK